MKSCGHLDELNRLQEELKLFATTNEPDKVNHLQLERLLSFSSTSRNRQDDVEGGWPSRRAQ